MPKDLGLEQSQSAEWMSRTKKATVSGERPRASGVLQNFLIFFLLEGGIRSKQF